MKSLSQESGLLAQNGIGLDLGVIGETFRNEPELLAELVVIFTDQLPVQLDRLGAALANGDVVALRRAAHQFIGSCVVFGASECVVLGRQVEACPDGAHEQMRGTVARLSVCAWRLLEVLRSYVGLEAPGATGPLSTERGHFA